MLQLNKETYIWEILSIETFAEQLAYRLKRGYRIKWDAEHEAKANWYNHSQNADYKAINSYTEDIRLLEKEILALQDELKTMQLNEAQMVAAAEVVLPNGQLADVMAYNDKEIIIIEVKAHKSDYLRDQKWTNYLPYCNKFFFLLDFSISSYEDEAGYLQLRNDTIYTKKNSVFKKDIIEDRRFAIARALSKKMIFGWN